MSLERPEHNHELAQKNEATSEGKLMYSEMYEPLQDVYVSVSARAFEASTEKMEDAEKAVVFIPGWLMTAKDESIVGLCQAYAQRTGRKVYAISTEGADCRKDGGKIDLLAEEARGIVAFIRGQGIRDVIVAGHSRGGNEAIHVAALLQKEPAIQLSGLIALNSAGLFTQDTDAVGLGLASAIPSEISAYALKGLLDPKDTEKQMRFATDMSNNLWSTIIHYNVSYPFRLHEEAQEANTQNPHMKNITAPVVLVFGKQDRVASMHEKRSKLHELFPQSPSVRPIVVDAGHMWPLEEPTEAARRTLDGLGVRVLH